VKGFLRYRQLQEVHGACPDDVSQLGVRAGAEGEHDAHSRQLVVDDLQPGQAGFGAQARAGDQHVERSVVGEHVAHRAEALAGDHLGAGPQLAGHGLDLVEELSPPVENEDLRVSHFGAPKRP
jgi:hypothetical protein